MNDATKNPFAPFFDEIRQIVREEIGAAVKAQTKPKLTLDTKEAAELLNVPETWLAAAARDGRIPSLRIGHYVRFKPADLENFINSKERDTKNVA
jgi:excisionase family DNA binding protein